MKVKITLEVNLDAGEGQDAMTTMAEGDGTVPDEIVWKLGLAAGAAVRELLPGITGHSVMANAPEWITGTVQ